MTNLTNKIYNLKDWTTRDTDKIEDYYFTVATEKDLMIRDEARAHLEYLEGIPMNCDNIRTAQVYSIIADVYAEAYHNSFITDIRVVVTDIEDMLELED